MKAKKFAALALCALLLLPSALSCSCKHTDGDTTTAQGSSAITIKAETGGDETDANGYIKDKIPSELTFNGETVNVMLVSERYVNVLDSDELNKSIQNRADYVSGRINATLNINTTSFNTVNYASLADTLENAAAAGNTEYDIVSQTKQSLGVCACRGLLYDLNKSEFIDPESPWWPGYQDKTSAFGDKLYVLTGDASISATQHAYCIFANANLAYEAGYTDLHALVSDKKWTTEAFLKMSTDVKLKDNADGSSKYFATYGNETYTDALLYGAGYRYIDKTEGSYDVSGTLGDEAFSSFFDKYVSFFSSGNVTKKAAGADNGFTNGNVLFHIGCVCDAETSIINPSFTVALMPLPLYDGDQAAYLTGTAVNAVAFGVCADSQRRTAATAALETMASYGYRNTRPAYFKTIFSGNNMNTSGNEKTFGLLHTGTVSDAAGYYSSWLGNLTSSFRKVLDPDSRWSAIYADNLAAWEKGIVSLEQQSGMK